MLEQLFEYILEQLFEYILVLYKMSEEVTESANDELDVFLDDLAGASRVKEEEDEMITLRVQQEVTVDFYFTMKRKEPLRKHMIAYCERRKLGDFRSLRFHHDGDRITGMQTPDKLELESCDVIDAWFDQIDGAPPNYLIFPSVYRLYITMVWNLCKLVACNVLARLSLFALETKIFM